VARLQGADGMLSCAGVSKSYDRVQALAPTDLTLDEGRTTVLIGPSGCGKSTLLRLMVGLIEPDAGEVRFGGEVLAPSNVERLRRRMGYVIQEGGLFPHLTARGNVTLMARHLGWERERLRARLAELAELVQLPVDLLERHPVDLSGGQRQRVGLMRALMLDPRVLLLDEPLGALDPMIRAELQADLRRIVRELDKTVALVTHDLGEAAYFGHKIAVMREGRIVQRGTFSELVGRPADEFVTRFVSAQRPPPELLEGGLS
jgi:osmoprotectant transport system ATP-binding protein